MLPQRILAICALVVLTGLLVADEASWKRHNENWRNAFSAKIFSEALKEAEAAVADAEKSFGVNDARHAQSLDTLGETYIAVGRLAEAEQRFRQAVVIRQRLSGAVIAAEYLSGTNVYLDQSRCAAIVASLGTYLGSQPPPSFPADIRLVPSLVTMGRCQKTLGKLEESEATLRRALNLSVATADIVSIAELLGQMLSEEYRSTEAVEFFRLVAEALELSSSVPLQGNAGLILGRVLDEMGTTLEYAGRYDESDGCFQRWMDLSERLNVADRVAYENLSRLRLRQGYSDEAEGRAQRDTDRSRGTIVQASPVPEAYSVLGEVYRDRGDFTAAEQVLRRALELAIQTDNSGRMHSILGDVYRGMGRNIDAETEYERAKAIFEKGYGGAKSPPYAAVVGEIGYLRLKQGSPAQAEALLNQAIGTIQAVLGTRHPSVGRLKWYFAQLHRAQGKYSESEQDYREAVDILEKALGMDQPSLVPLLADFADFLRSRQRAPEATVLASRARKLGEMKTHTAGRDRCNTTWPGVRVSGTVTREGNQAAAANQRQILLYGSGRPLVAAVAPDGAFAFPNVRPGTYQAVVGPFVTTQPITVVVADKDLSGIQFSVPMTFPIRVTASVEGGGLLPRFQLSVAALSGAGTVAATRTVSLTVPGAASTVQVPAGDYRVISTALPAGYSVASITAGSVDLRTQAIRISSADSPGVAIRLSVSSPPPWVNVKGRVIGRPATATEAVLALTGPEVNRAALVRPDGSFDFDMLLPGVYSASIATGNVSSPPAVVVIGRQDVVDLEIAAR